MFAPGGQALVELLHLKMEIVLNVTILLINYFKNESKEMINKKLLHIQIVNTC